MNDETKKLFDAPWAIYGEPDDYSFVLQDASEDEIATIFTTDNAKRIARLPELYEALMEAARYRCWHCRHEDFPDFACIEDFEKNCKTVSCGCRDWWELLRKVRDGK